MMTTVQSKAVVRTLNGVASSIKIPSLYPIFVISIYLPPTDIRDKVFVFTLLFHIRVRYIEV